MKKLLVLFALFLLLAPAAHAAEPDDGTLPPISVGQPTIDRLLHLTDSLYAIGFTFADKGYSRIANWYIGQSVAAISSLRGAATDLYHAKQEEARDARIAEGNEHVKNETGFDLNAILSIAEAVSSFADMLADEVKDQPLGFDIKHSQKVWWPARQSISLVSPYVPLLRGLVLDYQGDTDGAAECYTTALLNPYLDPELVDFTFLADMEPGELLALCRTLSGRENEYRTFFTGDGYFFDLPAKLPWSDEYHRAMAISWLDGETPEYYKAFGYLEAALHANPFNIVNYENLARLCVVTANYHDLATYVMEGLAIDPDNEFFLGMDRIYAKYQNK